MSALSRSLTRTQPKVARSDKEERDAEAADDAANQPTLLIGLRVDFGRRARLTWGQPWCWSTRGR